MQGLLDKKPEQRLDWPHLLDHPFVKESEEERLAREHRIYAAAAFAEASRAWKGEHGAIAGAAVYSGVLRRIAPIRVAPSYVMSMLSVLVRDEHAVCADVCDDCTERRVCCVH